MTAERLLDAKVDLERGARPVDDDDREGEASMGELVEAVGDAALECVAGALEPVGVLGCETFCPQVCRCRQDEGDRWEQTA